MSEGPTLFPQLQYLPKNLAHDTALTHGQRHDLRNFDHRLRFDRLPLREIKALFQTSSIPT